MHDSKNQASIDEIRGQYPRVIEIDAFGERLVFRPIDRDTWDTFRRYRDDAQRKPMSDDWLCTECVVYPDKASFEKLLDRWPMVGMKVSMILRDDAGHGDTSVETDIDPAIDLSSEERALVEKLRTQHGDVTVVRAFEKLAVFRPMDRLTSKRLRRDAMSEDAKTRLRMAESAVFALRVHPEEPELRALIEEHVALPDGLAVAIMRNAGADDARVKKA